MHAKQLHKTRFYSITLLVIVALLTQTTQEIIPNFSVRRFNMAEIANDCMCPRNLKTVLCPLLSDHPPNPVGNHFYLSWGIWLALFDNKTL